MGYAIVEEVEVGFRTLTQEERERTAALLEEAALVIDAYGKDADPDVKRLVSCRMVRRLLGDGTGGETPLYPMALPRGPLQRWAIPRAGPWAAAAVPGSCTSPSWKKSCWVRATASARPARWRGFAMLRGIDVVLYEKHQTGEDAFHTPVYEETPVTVHNVLVGAPDTAAIVNELTLTGRRLAYTLALPKGDSHDWHNVTVEFFGQKFRTYGDVVQGMESLVPLAWNKQVKVERYG